MKKQAEGGQDVKESDQEAEDLEERTKYLEEKYLWKGYLDSVNRMVIPKNLLVKTERYTFPSIVDKRESILMKERKERLEEIEREIEKEISHSKDFPSMMIMTQQMKK